MFGSSKPTASLSSGLLARKGQARPAMRPQGFHTTSLNLEDLGWNDMGDDPAPVAAIRPVEAAPAQAPVPPVLIARETLAQEIAAAVEPPNAAPEPADVPLPLDAVESPPAPVETPHPVSTATVARIAREVTAGKTKAAFTLRLDADRHLKLRLASASRHRSAQALVTAALDTFLASLPEVEGLAAQLAPKPTSAKG